jgi:probable rRNA maturation factor
VGGFCAAVLRALGERPSGVSVVFVGREAIRDLNARYRGQARPTDVLSFPYPGERVDGRRYLGDIVIAPDVAGEHAGVRRGGSLDTEMRMLLVHGVLHLIGYDHETDSGEMLRLQARLLRRPELAAAPLLGRGRRDAGDRR